MTPVVEEMFSCCGGGFALGFAAVAAAEGVEEEDLED